LHALGPAGAERSSILTSGGEVCRPRKAVAPVEEWREHGCRAGRVIEDGRRQGRGVWRQVGQMADQGQVLRFTRGVLRSRGRQLRMAERGKVMCRRQTGSYQGGFEQCARVHEHAGIREHPLG
jgi:hypothetical protein